MDRFAGTLTAEHLELVNTELDRWLSAGLSTERCDRPAAEAAAKAAYRTAGFDEPLLTIWMDSPLGGTFAVAATSQLGNQLGDQLGGQLGDQLRGQLRGQLVYESISTWWDAYWLGLYRCALPAAELPASDRLDAMVGVSEQASWWWPRHGFVVLTDRPTVLSRDGQGRLHSTTGPAVAYADGYDLWAVGGVRVPREIVEHPEKITPSSVFAEGNAEVRRVMIEQVGWDRFVTDAGLALIDEQPDPGNPGEMLGLYDVPEQVYDEKVRVVLCTNASPERDGTRRRFGLTVPADMPDAITAAAWTFGLDSARYRELERAT